MRVARCVSRSGGVCRIGSGRAWSACLYLQIPIFISLYRALLNLAKENALDEPFLWLPNLEGPTYGAQNADWLFKFENWNDFTPPLGWASTVAFLSLPILLIVSQKASMKLLQARPSSAALHRAAPRRPLFVCFCCGFVLAAASRRRVASCDGQLAGDSYG